MPNFEITIDSTNSPVAEGEPVEVNYTVTNTGTNTDTQSVELHIEESITGHEAGVNPATIDRYVYEDGGTYYVDDDEGGTNLSTHTDLNSALQAAIDGSNGGNTVLADDSYWTSNPTPVDLSDGVGIYGRGGASIHLDWGTDDTRLFEIEGANNWRLDGVQLIGETLEGSMFIGDETGVGEKDGAVISNCTMQSSGWAMINWDNMTNSEIRNCWFKDVDTLGSGNGVAVRHHSCDWCSVHDCIFESGSGDPRTLLFIDDRNNTFENNEFYVNNNEWYGAVEFAADGDLEIYNNEIRNNLLEGTGSGGGVYAGTTNTTDTNYVENNTFRDLGHGHDCTDSGGGFYVADNTFENCVTTYTLHENSTDGGGNN